MRINDGPKTKIKSSGLCVTTGTGTVFYVFRKVCKLIQNAVITIKTLMLLGSTSWNLSINRLTQQSVSEVLRLLQDKRPDLPGFSGDVDLVQDLADEFNSSLVFPAGG